MSINCSRVGMTMNCRRSLYDEWHIWPVPVCVFLSAMSCSCWLLFLFLLAFLSSGIGVFVFACLSSSTLYDLLCVEQP